MDQLDIIRNLFVIRCNYVHANCKTIAERITNFHSQKNYVDNDFFSAYLLYLCDGSDYSFEKCINHIKISIPIIKKILSYLKPTLDDLIILAKIKPGNTNQEQNENQLDIFKIIIENNNNIIPIEVLYNALIIKNVNLATYLINFTNPNSLCLDDLLIDILNLLLICLIKSL